jgi:hypothetical protein
MNREANGAGRTESSMGAAAGKLTRDAIPTTRGEIYRRGRYGDREDASLDEVMAAAPPSFLTGQPEQRRSEPRPSPWNGPRQRWPPRSAPERAVAPPRVMGAISAFTLIQPLGLSERTVRGTMQGDGAANVMHQNNTWAGFSSGGSRRG